MSKPKIIILVTGLVAVAAVVFAGAHQLTASSIQGSSVQNPASQSGTDAKTKSSCPASACAKTASASKSCPLASACAGAAGGKDKDCSSWSSCAGSCRAKPSKTADVEAIRGREGRRVVLVGRYVCGSCQLGAGDRCQPAFQTRDGKNYLLVKNNLSKELRDVARDKDAEIVTRVRKLDGVNYLSVEAIRNVS